MTEQTPGPSKKKMSTGAKIAIGLGVFVLLGMMAMTGVVVMGGLFLRDRASGFMASMEEQEEATQILEELEREVPFDPPPDGVVTDDQARRFFGATDAAWQEMEPWANELRDLSERVSARENPSVSDVVAGVQNVGRIAESRTVLARALEENRISSGEFVWTGLSLARAYTSLSSSGESAGIPAENLALAERYQADIAAISGDSGADRGAILGLAAMWGMADESTWRALGLDTLYGR